MIASVIIDFFKVVVCQFFKIVFYQFPVLTSKTVNSFWGL